MTKILKKRKVSAEKLKWMKDGLQTRMDDKMKEWAYDLGASSYKIHLPSHSKRKWETDY